MRRRSSFFWLAATCLSMIYVPETMAAPPIQRPVVPGAPSTDPTAEAPPTANPDLAADTDPTATDDAATEAEPTTSLPESDGLAHAGRQSGGPPTLPPEALGADLGPPPSSTHPLAALADVPASSNATRDAAWEGVDGFEVVMELDGGEELKGTIGAVQRNTITLIEVSTGSVLVVLKSSVLSLRVYRPPAVPVRTGVGLLAGGGVLIGVGGPVFISGAATLGACPSCIAINLPLLLIGGGSLAAGIPMVVRGIRRRRVRDDALQRRTLTPTASRTRHGWTAGLRLRF